MFMLVINQSNGTTIKPLKSKSFKDAAKEEAKILKNGGYEGSLFHSEVVKIHRDGRISQTFRDKNPFSNHPQSDIWRDRGCALVKPTPVESIET